MTESQPLIHMQYVPGKFVNASFDHASEENERNRFEMIRFGSRVNCEIPADYELHVKAGDMVTAGSTVIARKPENEGDSEGNTHAEA
ncbi:MAG: hypothetical protein Q9M12_01540 [Mariprofundus sp.]|nr:hypothetical protein [Mariprofundus sp.]